MTQHCFLLYVLGKTKQSKIVIKKILVQIIIKSPGNYIDNNHILISSNNWSSSSSSSSNNSSRSSTAVVVIAAVTGAVGATDCRYVLLLPYNDF